MTLLVATGRVNFYSGGNHLLAMVAVVSTVMVCSYTDWKRRKIYNAVLIPSLVGALAWQWMQGGMAGLAAAGGGFLVGGALLIVPFITGGLGAGDLKMMAVVGAWQGMLFTLEAVLLGMIAGGLMSLIVLLRQKQLAGLLSNILSGFITLIYSLGRINPFPRLEPNQRAGAIPYGIALAGGTILALLI